MFALGFAWPERHLEWYAALDRHPWMLALVNVSEPAMDFFLILTGFLATRSLTRALRGGVKGPVQVRCCVLGPALQACMHSEDSCTLLRAGHSGYNSVA